MDDATRGPQSLFDSPLGAIVHAAREAIVMIDDEQRIVALNPAARRMFRCDAESAVGRPLSILIPAHARAAHASHVARFAASGQAERDMGRGRPIEGLRADGETFPAEAAISRIELDVGGRPRPIFVALLRDLSREVALQVELDSLPQRIRALLERAPVAMWVCDGARVRYANQAARDLFGVPRGDDVAGRAVFDLLAADSHAELKQQIQAALDGKPVVPIVSSRLVRAGGDVREVEIATTAMPDHGRTVVQMVIADITQRVQQVRDAARHRLELRRLSDRLVDAREEERRRIARELHDELGQRLSALKMQLASLAPSAGAAAIADMVETIDDTVAAVRRIAADLRPLMLDDLGLDAAIEALVRDAGARLGIDVSVRVEPVQPPVGDRVAIAVYRMVQEALTNVGRHAEASAVHVHLRPRGNDLVLTVQDDGVGFPDRSARHDNRYGLLGMRERAFMLGGTFEVDNPPGGGGRVTVRLPLSPASPGTDAAASTLTAP